MGSLPGPMCIEKRSILIDEGTMCRAASPLPGPVQASETPLDRALRVLEADAVNFASRFIQDAAVRQQYVASVRRYADEVLVFVRKGNITPSEGEQLAHSMRNQIMETARLASSDIGKAQAALLKGKGLSLDALHERSAQQLFKRGFTQLTETERNQVSLAIIESSGRANPGVTLRAVRLARIGKGLLVVTIGLAIIHIAVADDKVEAAAREGTGLAGGFLGGAAGGATAGLLCGPGAPVCVTIGVFVGGAIGALGLEYFFFDAKAGNIGPRERETIGHHF